MESLSIFWYELSRIIPARLLTTVRILETEPNRKGDLFTKLMCDLFVVLGYEQPSINLQKIGREVDLSAKHRLEDRRMIAECKATESPVGGRELNTFVGVLDAETGNGLNVCGYFVSLAGFSSTALAQESTRRTRLYLISGEEAIQELIRGGALAPPERVTEAAGRLFSGDTAGRADLDLRCELLVHARGAMWAVYYTSGGSRTHCALLASDGTPLAATLARAVIDDDRKCGGKLHQLGCLNIRGRKSIDPQSLATALQRYREDILSGCDYIQFDGMPADGNLSARRVPLDSLFVPLHLDCDVDRSGAKRESVATVISNYRHLAILAPPGGGKSTLIKRLATAYVALGETRLGDLPQKDWLPLLVRCRELRSRVRASFAELIHWLCDRETLRRHSDSLRTHIEERLVSGGILLLIDGLDEIPDEGDRAAFACTLRAIVKAYPEIGLIVTSREAGFRHIATHLVSVCTRATLSPLNHDDIRQFCRGWFRAGAEDLVAASSDANAVVDTIIQDRRILEIAVNPLLLTTLLLVKRWLGALPSRRTVLYGEAVKLLLRTWNSEAHQPILEDEAVPQLSYVAYSMFREGLQRIAKPHLRRLLLDARRDLPMELGYVRESVDEFIGRIESRTSLLMLSGYDVDSGQLTEYFEFRHLAFQEFLTAKGIVERYYPQPRDSDRLIDQMEPFLSDDRWNQVVPLAAVLAGRRADSLIRRLTELASGNHRIGWLLAWCLADEALAARETISDALDQLIRPDCAVVSRPWDSFFQGRHSAEIRTRARAAFFSISERPAHATDILASAVWCQTTVGCGDKKFEVATDRFIEMVRSTNEIERCEGALGVQRLVEQRDVGDPDADRCKRRLAEVHVELARLAGATRHERWASWTALERLGVDWLWKLPPNMEVARVLWEVWRQNQDETERFFLNHVIACQPLLNRDELHVVCSLEEFKAIVQSMHSSVAEILVAWYERTKSDFELIFECHKLIFLCPGVSEPGGSRVRELLTRLGDDPNRPWSPPIDMRWHPNLGD